jgi:hypothetical protein
MDVPVGLFRRGLLIALQRSSAADARTYQMPCRGFDWPFW